MTFLGIMGGGVPLKPPKHHNSTVLKSLMGDLNWVPRRPKHASYTYSRCKIFQSGIRHACSAYVEEAVSIAHENRGGFRQCVSLRCHEVTCGVCVCSAACFCIIL